jgi:hypothetical protein
MGPGSRPRPRQRTARTGHSGSGPPHAHGAHDASQRPRARRYENAQKHLADFDQGLSRRQFDKGRLDTAIDDVKNVVDGNPLSPDAKQELSRDLAELRDLRERFDRGELREFH